LTPWPLVTCNERALCSETVTILTLPVLTVIASAEVLKHRNYVCLSSSITSYGLNKIKRVFFGAQYKIVLLTLLTS